MHQYTRSKVHKPGLITFRPRWRWSCYSSDVEHCYRHQLHYACCLLCSGRSYRQQTWNKVGFGYRCLLVPHPWLIILLQLEVRQPVVLDSRWLLHWYRNWYLVCCRVWHDHVARTIWISREISGSVDCREEPWTTCRRSDQPVKEPCQRCCGWRHTRHLHCFPHHRVHGPAIRLPHFAT